MTVEELLGHATGQHRDAAAHSNHKAKVRVVAKPPTCETPVTVVFRQAKRPKRQCDMVREMKESDRIMNGGMGEWLKPAVLKTVYAERCTGVRIPLPPPDYLIDSR